MLSHNYVTANIVFFFHLTLFGFFFLTFCLSRAANHMEVPMLGVKSELLPQQRQIQAVSATYTTAHGNAGSLTH